MCNETKQINAMIKNPEYDFLRNNEHLKNRVFLLTLGGSRAYGTNLPDSDWDLRGIAYERPHELIGLNSFEQIVDVPTDTIIYGFNKMCQLLMEYNPNTVEILGCKPEHYIILDETGKQLIENTSMFLSQKVFASFGGYANQQLRRLENALARDSYPQSEKEKHIMQSCLSAMMSFTDRYAEFPEGSIILSLDKSHQPDRDTEIYVDVNLKHYPLRDYKNIWADMNNIVKDYSKLNKRNKKKDDEHLNKHAMHLIRLFIMGLDIVENNRISTFREKEHDLLMSIRNGEFQKEDKSFRPEFFEMLDSYENKFKYAKENTSLPEYPNYRKIEEFIVEVNKKIIERN